MNKTFLEKCPLFLNIMPDDFDSLLQCLAAKKKLYKSGTYIFSEGAGMTDIGIIISGTAQIVKEDYWGNRTIITQLSAGDLFGESFALSSDNISGVNIIAVENCEILTVNHMKIITVCPSSCGFHLQLIKNMLKILADKNVVLTEKIEFITKRTIREKLLAYFSYLAKRQGTATITVSFDRQELADFLSVDRSALSRELSRMKQEGLIDYKRNKIALL